MVSTYFKQDQCQNNSLVYVDLDVKLSQTEVIDEISVFRIRQ